MENISAVNSKQQIYFDEIGINKNFTRYSAHAVHGKRTIKTSPISMPVGTTVLLFIRLNSGLIYPYASMWNGCTAIAWINSKTMDIKYWKTML